MSHRNTNIENYLYFADSEDLAGSNDDDKIVMFPTSAITAIIVSSTSKGYKTLYRRQDGSHAFDHASCEGIIQATFPDIDQWVNGLNMLVANYQKDSTKGMVVIADTANNISCNAAISSAAGTVVLGTTAL